MVKPAPSFKKILEHPDRDEIISKLIIGIPSKEISEWLHAKYFNLNETRFTIGESSLDSFSKNYLDIYQYLKQDISTVETALTKAQSTESIVKGNKAYKQKVMELAEKKLDVKTIVINMVVAIEDRLSQLYDNIQEDPSSFREDRKLMEWFNTLGLALDRYYKIVEQGPDQIIQHNVTLQAVDQHINVFQEVIRKTLEQMDVETSLYFMEIFNQEMSKLRQQNATAAPNLDVQLTDAKLLAEKIHEKLMD
jgi:hypothetical protein